MNNADLQPEAKQVHEGYKHGDRKPEFVPFQAIYRGFLYFISAKMYFALSIREEFQPFLGSLCKMREDV